MNSASPMSSYSFRFLVSILLGLGIGVAYLIVATIILLVVGSAAFAESYVSYGSVAMVYLLGGAAGGFLVGVLNPLARTRVGCVILGIVGMVPMSAGAGLLLAGPFWRSGDSLFAFAVTAVLVGGGIGFIMSKDVVGNNAE